MRGSPLFRALIAFAAFAALGWPLCLITHRSATARSSSEDLSVPVRRTGLALAFTLPPRSVEVRHLGQRVWAAMTPGPVANCILELPWPKEGIDLQFQIDWPADSPLAAARVQLTDPDGNEHVKSLWSRGPASEVLTFP